MSHLRLVLPGACALGAALLTVAPTTRAWVLTGESLALDQRDVRVFDNFTDVEAHSNTQPDPSFPGWTGAYLALWKSIVEWGSEPHLEGLGDPYQPGDLGSGGANFDASWQGAAPGVGGPDDNVMSEISGNNPGILAYCETPTGDGWRIRFYRQPWLWFDRPSGGTIGPYYADLQGVGTHEYGHALGLGHSAVADSTMYASAPTDEALWRSLESDDRAGLQAIYGARLASKPHVANYALPGPGLVRISGANFAASGNRVWFTAAGQSADGVPVTVAGVASTLGGTELLVALPAGAGPGDLLVDNGGSAAADLSNAFPFDPTHAPCFAPSAWGTSWRNSSGQPARIGYQGFPSAGATHFTISIEQAPANENAVLIRSAASADLPFHGSRLRLAAPRERAARLTLDPFGAGIAAIEVAPALVGTTLYYQWWFADAADPRGQGLSDALRVDFCP